MGLSGNTIKKYRREGAVEPKFKTPKRPSKLDPYADRLFGWLLAQTRKFRTVRGAVKQTHGFKPSTLTRQMQVVRGSVFFCKGVSLFALAKPKKEVRQGALGFVQGVKAQLS